MLSLHHVVITFILAPFFTFGSDLNISKEAKQFYAKCKSAGKPGVKVKCIGFPGDCMKSKKCTWIGFVAENKTHLEGSFFDKCDHAAKAAANPEKWPQQSFVGYGFATYDKTMTAIECRKPELDDYKFFIFFNDTICKGNDPNDEAYQVSNQVTDRMEYFDKCNKEPEVIPPPSNTNYKFNLPYFLRHFLYIHSATVGYKDPFDFSETMNYKIKDRSIYYSELTTDAPIESP